MNKTVRLYYTTSSSHCKGRAEIFVEFARIFLIFGLIQPVIRFMIAAPCSLSHASCL